MELHEQENLEHLINNKHVIKKKRINPLEEGEEWKIQLIEELSLIKLGFLSIDMEEKDINRMLKNLSTSWMSYYGVEWGVGGVACGLSPRLIITLSLNLLALEGLLSYVKYFIYWQQNPAALVILNYTLYNFEINTHIYYYYLFFH